MTVRTYLIFIMNHDYTTNICIAECEKEQLYIRKGKSNRHNIQFKDVICCIIHTPNFTSSLAFPVFI